LNNGNYGAAALNMSLNLFGTVLFAGIGFLGVKFLLS
jgi:hypothetical protein